MTTSKFKKQLARVSRFLRGLSYQHPWKVILSSAALAILGGYIYFFHLEIISDRKQLINKELESNRIYTKYSEEFGVDELLVLVVSASPLSTNGTLPPIPDSNQRLEMKKVAQRWAEQLRKRPDLFPQVTDRIEWPGNKSLALLYLPLKNLKEVIDPIHQHKAAIHELVKDASIQNQLSLLNTIIRNIGSDSTLIKNENVPALVTNLQLYIHGLSGKIKGESNAFSQLDGKSALSFYLGSQYDLDGFIFSEDGRILMVFANVDGDSGQKNRYSEVMEYAEAALQNAISGKLEVTQIDAGLAGMPALEYEEMKAAQSDFARGAIIALILITILSMLVFGNVIRPGLAALTLCFSIGITFGFAWLAIGHLNLLAMVFTIILVALGIDFAIHFLTHYEQSLAAGHSPAKSIENTYHSIGSALWMGGITTVAAFLSAFFTEFVGLSELGLIAGGGLFICLACMYFVYPAMLFLLDTHYAKVRETIKSPQMGNFLPNYVLKAGGEENSKALKFFCTGSLLLICLGYVLGQYTFDTNLLKLQPTNGNASRWQNLLIRTDDRTLFAVSTFKDRTSLEKAQELFESTPDLVRRTESLYPAQEREKRAYLASICSTYATVAIGKPARASLFALKRHTWNLRHTIRKYRRMNSQADSALAGLEDALNSFYSLLGKQPQEQILQNINNFQDEIYHNLKVGFNKVRDFFCLPALTLNHIPESLKMRYMGKNGDLALFIYPTANTWEQDHLKAFVEGLREIDANVVGELVSLHENGNSIIRSFLQASVYSLIAILCFLLLWLRSIRTSLLAILPLVASVGWLLGIMKILPETNTWNFTNFFAVPILIGIGVDSGIHIVRAWTSDNPEILHGAVKAVFLSAVTTMIGFGILTTSHHAGVSSLGKILLFGISLGLLASSTVLPAALKMYMKKGLTQ